MKGIRKGALALALGLVLALAACGGDDGDSTSAEAPTKEEFIAAGNEICADANAEAEAAAQEVFDSVQPTTEEIDQFVQDIVIPSVEGQISDLEALGAPEGDEEEVDAIIAAVRQGLEEVQADSQAILSNPFEEANQLAVDYGLNDCAS